MQFFMLLIIVAIAFYLHSQKVKRDEVKQEQESQEKEALAEKIRSSTYYNSVYGEIMAHKDELRELIVGVTSVKIALLSTDEPLVQRLGEGVRPMDENEIAVFCELIAELLGEEWDFALKDEDMKLVIFTNKSLSAGLKDPF